MFALHVFHISSRFLLLLVELTRRFAQLMLRCLRAFLLLKDLLPGSFLQLRSVFLLLPELPTQRIELCGKLRCQSGPLLR